MDEDADLTGNERADGGGLRRIPVIAMSGIGSAADLERIASVGFEAHLTKPMVPNVIEEQLQRIRKRSR